MRVIRKFAVQGHAVPESAHSPQGPFPQEIMAEPKLEYQVEHSDSLHEGFDTVRLFKCRDCQDILYQDQLDEHECDD
jgi:hypothetical protein